jgi:hypothetical protein
MPARPYSETADNPQEVLAFLEGSHWKRTIDASGITAATSEVTHDTREAILSLLGQLNHNLTVLQGPVQGGLQDLLGLLAGRSFGSLVANQAVAREIQELLNRLGLRVACPRQGCGLPASIRCAAAGNSRHGVFQFDHSVGGRRTTHLGSSLFPLLQLVPAPPDRRKQHPRHT